MISPTWSLKLLFTVKQPLKNKKTAVGSARKKCRKLQFIETFFQTHDLVTAKQLLSSMMQYAVNGKGWIKENPSVILQFHKSLCIFIHEGYMISKKTKKWQVNAPSDIGSPMMKSSLSDKEYENPILVFKRAFKEYSIQEFDYFISGIVYFSQQMYRHGPESNLVRPYIHLSKMLDAAYLILEKGLQKSNNKKIK
ncbi:hypothetical protein [Chryseobacterium sp. Bi04]|uniref:hypothetical protein n=1 Tax=Chryseobacterium sp. Bi04 TaxID=2822345 RepID=UPI001D97C671|nr:hypothetical protein [Chryseobacterium sp. Bi04]CAH0195652.1 hypothetical protein SRABI04_01851 [Chryseobacterium sp. Bi04]